MFMGGRKERIERECPARSGGWKILHEVLVWYMAVAFLALSCVLHRHKDMHICIFVNVFVCITSTLKEAKIFIFQSTTFPSNLQYDSNQWLHLALYLFLPLPQP